MAATGTAIAQLTTSPKKPPLIHQGPTLKPTNTMSVRDTLDVRKVPAVLNAQFQVAFAPYIFLSWKDASRRMEFEVRHIGATYPKAQVSVYAFQEPAPTFSPPELQLTALGQVQNTNQTQGGRRVYSRQLSDVTKDSHFTIDFSGITPSGIATDTANPKGGVLGIKRPIRGGGENRPPIEIGVKGGSPDRDRNALIGNLIRAQGYVRFFVRIEVPGVQPSTCAVVDYGEPQPSNQGTTKLEVFIEKSTEFGESWGLDRDVFGASYVFRWTTQQSGEAAAMWQMSDVPFPENPVLFKDPTLNLAWGDLKELAQAAIPEGKAVAFPADIGWIFPNPGDTEKSYYVRVLVFNADGTLRGPPSNVVKLHLRKAPPQANPPPSNYLSFDVDLVGYKPPCFGTDPYRFLLTRTPTSDLDEWKKLTGKQNPGEGDWVYLPPAEPEDKAWYEKVADAIKWCIGKLKDLADTIEFYGWVLDQVFVQLPIRFVNYVAAETKLDKVSAAVGLDYAFAAAGWAKGEAFAMTNVAANPDYYAASILDKANVPGADWINLRGKVTSAVSKSAFDSRPTNPEDFKKLLVPNPEYIQHPGFAYLRIHATQHGDKSVPIVSSPGSYHLAAMGWYSDPQSPDANKGWQDMYDKSVSMPSMCDGMTMIVPIALDYAPGFYKNPKQWMTRYGQCTSVRWLLDYSEIKVVKGTAGWGK